MVEFSFIHMIVGRQVFKKYKISNEDNLIKSLFLVCSCAATNADTISS